MLKNPVKPIKVKNAKPLLQIWDFVPANENSRGNGTIGAGGYYGSGCRPKRGKIRESSMIVPGKDITSGFTKPITQA